jgi:hypothetical protein
VKPCNLATRFKLIDKARYLHLQGRRVQVEAVIFSEAFFNYQKNSMPSNLENSYCSDNVTKKHIGKKAHEEHLRIINVNFKINLVL